MKFKLIIILALLLVLQVIDQKGPLKDTLREPAATSGESTKEYKYVYLFEGKPFDIEVEGKDWNEGLMTAAQACFQFYHKKNQGESHALDVIDACANPL